MRTREDIEAFLNRSGHPHKEVEKHTWLVKDPSEGRDNVVIHLAGDLILFRLKVLELASVDASKTEALLRKVLEINGEDMIHGSYGIVDDALIMTATLRLENLDYSEFSGTLDDFSLAITNH